MRITPLSAAENPRFLPRRPIHLIIHHRTASQKTFPEPLPSLRVRNVKLVVQIPALNEAATIADVVQRIPKNIPGITSLKVVVVNDGSTDETAALAEANGAIVISHETPRGVGSAFRSGIEKAGELCADIVVTIDGDAQFRPEDIPLVIQPILDGNADFVTASRFKDPELLPTMPKAKRWGNDFIARWISRLIGKKFHDVSCGFRAYSRNAYLRLVLMGDFTYTHETFICLAFARMRMMEVPIKVRGVREHGESRVASSVFKYGARAASIILRSYRDYKPLRFFSWFAGGAGVLGIGFFIFLMSWWFRNNHIFTPHKWAGFVAAFFLIVSLFLFITGIVVEILDRIRVTQEETVFRVRKLDIELREREERWNSRGGPS